jgi:hypothetical protein
MAKGKVKEKGMNLKRKRNAKLEKVWRLTGAAKFVTRTCGPRCEFEMKGVIEVEIAPHHEGSGRERLRAR